MNNEAPDVCFCFSVNERLMETDFSKNELFFSFQSKDHINSFNMRRGREHDKVSYFVD